MRIDAARKLAEIMGKHMPDWDFEVFATDSGNAKIAATSKDLQSSFLIEGLPPTEGKRGFPEMEKTAEAIASVNPALHSSGVNVYGRTDKYAFDATVNTTRVSIHSYCDADTAIKIARLLGEQ